MSTTPTPIPQPSRPTAPPAGDRASSATIRLIEAQNEARKQYAPNRKKDQTYCNDATFCIARRMEAPLRDLGDAHGEPYSADQMAHNLAGSTDYRDVAPEQAQQLANEGALVIGAWFNPHGHGHVVTVRPEGVPGDDPYGHSGPILNNIGETDGIARQSGAFKAGDKVFYYTPDTRGKH